MRELHTYLELLVVLGVACFGFLAFLLVGRQLGLAEAPLAAICGAAAVFTGALVAFRAFQLNRKIVQEPWSVIFRELHKEFWNDPELSRVRMWLCSDEAYETDLAPVLVRRRNQTVDKDSYSKLEALDKYCALMVRVTNLQILQMTKEQRVAYKALGYDWWLYKTTQRSEVREYIRLHWKNLDPLVPNVPPTTPGTPPSPLQVSAATPTSAAR